LTGLDANTVYALQVKVINNAPAGTALAAKESAICTATIHENNPEFFIFKGSDGSKGVAAKALIVGDDFGKGVSPGSIDIKNDIVFGGSIYGGVPEWKYLGNTVNPDTLRGREGRYGIYGRAEVPGGGIGTLEVIYYSGDWVTQRWTPISGGGENYVSWQRQWYAGVGWSAWKQQGAYLRAFGQIGGAANSPFAMYGFVESQMLGNYYRITGQGRVTAWSAGSGSDFAIGLRLAYIQGILGVPNYTSYVQYSNRLAIYNSSGARNVGDTPAGYGMTSEIVGGYLNAARYYDTSGNLGGWPTTVAAAYGVGSVWDFDFLVA
jgi:hypothetical protein